MLGRGGCWMTVWVCPVGRRFGRASATNGASSLLCKRSCWFVYWWRRNYASGGRHGILTARLVDVVKWCTATTNDNGVGAYNTAALNGWCSSFSIWPVYQCTWVHLFQLVWFLFPLIRPLVILVFQFFLLSCSSPIVWNVPPSFLVLLSLEFLSVCPFLLFNCRCLLSCPGTAHSLGAVSIMSSFFRSLAVFLSLDTLCCLPLIVYLVVTTRWQYLFILRVHPEKACFLV